MDSKDKERIVNGWLETSLKQYGEAEPRPGLENRVLATLRAEREQTNTSSWRWWPAVVAVGAILAIAAGVFLARSNRYHIQPPIAKELIAPVEVRQTDATPASKRHIIQAANQKPHAGAPRRGLQTIPESTPPRLEQFPSPEPLSEQEKILARYVRQFPREADLTAKVQTELARQEMLAEQSPPEGEIPANSEAQNQ